MLARTHRICRWLRIHSVERRGAAGVELALALPLLFIPIVNAIDFGDYLFEGMEVRAAADAAAQAAVTTCGWTSQLPAYGTNGTDGSCASLRTAATTAAQSTSLGTGVTISYPPANNNPPPEGYYCIDSGGTLQLVATPPAAKPADCSVAKNGSVNDTPGDYLQIIASYPYAPMFSGISLASSFTTPIVGTAWIRLQ